MQHEKIDKVLECLHNEQMERQKDGGAAAPPSGHSPPSPEFPSLLPLSAGQLFTVPCEVGGNE